ncbi:MAG: cyclic nucleotide-binding domain-containing protein [Candidatus Hodarchaeales archaeon]|jgi:CRP-like cAMP-binding protein
MPTSRMFEGLSKPEINQIFDLGVIRPIKEGELIFRKGDIGQEMYIILTGTIDIVDESKANALGIIAELGPGEVLGELAIFGESHEHSAHAIAREPAYVLVLSEEILNKLFEQEIPKKFVMNIIKILCHRLRVTNRMYMIAKFGEKLLPKGKSLE